MILSKTQVELAVNWWADAIRNPKHDNGDSSSTGGVTMALATMLSNNVITEEQIELFKQTLTSELEDNENIARYGIHCDYGPCLSLETAMNSGDIPPIQAPWKTNMRFAEGKVFVSYGYAAPEIELKEDQ
jgi:hypothetical protein